MSKEEETTEEIDVDTDVDVDVDFGDENSNGDFEPDEEIKITKEEMTEKIMEGEKPKPYDYEWTDYVLSDLHDNEIFDGNPTTNSLRRLANKFIGTIVSSTTHIQNSSEKYAVAVVTIGIKAQYSDEVIYYSGAADASPESVRKDPYNKHLVAMSETRAEGRALRKALQLRKTVSAEEMDINEDTSEVNTDSMTDSQINFIDIMSNNTRGVNINVTKLLKEMGYKCVKDLLHSDGVKIIGKLNEFQRNTESIDKDLKGYLTTWKEERE